MTHVVVIMPCGVQVDYWTDTPELMMARFREGGIYCFEGGLPQPVRTDDRWVDNPGMPV